MLHAGCDMVADFTPEFAVTFLASLVPDDGTDPKVGIRGPLVGSH